MELSSRLLVYLIILSSSLLNAGVDHARFQKQMKQDPKKYLSKINSGWPRSLKPLKSLVKRNRSYIVIVKKLPSVPLDLRDASRFRRSFLHQGFFNFSKSTIGHMMLGWRCRGSQTFEGITAMTGETNEQVPDMILAGWGNSSLFATYTDGYLENNSTIEGKLNSNNKVHTLAMEVSDKKCQQVRGFIERFATHKNKPFSRFGFLPRPHRMEGAGCSSFVLSALKVAGLMPKITPLILRKIDVPLATLGRGNERPKNVYIHPGYEASEYLDPVVWLAMDWSDGPSKTLPVNDPELLHLFYTTTYRSFLDSIYKSNLKLARRLIESPIYKYREVPADWTPNSGWSESSINTKMERIDGSFDHRAKAVIQQTKSWNAKLLRKKYQAEVFSVGKSLGVVLHR